MLIYCKFNKKLWALYTFDLAWITYCRENGELDPKVVLSNDNTKNLYGIPLPDNVAFYRFEKVNIPDISNDVN